MNIRDMAVFLILFVGYAIQLVEAGFLKNKSPEIYAWAENSVPLCKPVKATSSAGDLF